MNRASHIGVSGVQCAALLYFQSELTEVLESAFVQLFKLGSGHLRRAEQFFRGLRRKPVAVYRWAFRNEHVEFFSVRRISGKLQRPFQRAPAVAGGCAEKGSVPSAQSVPRAAVEFVPELRRVGGVFLTYLREQSKQLRDCFGRRKRRAGSIEQRIGNIKKVCCKGQRPVSLVPAAVIEFVLTECDFQPAVAEKLRFVIGKQSVA